MEKNNLTKEELQVLKELNNPKKIQDFINKIPINFEKNWETCMSNRKVLETGNAHCIEGDLFY